ncbi:hypothetical protein FOCC_FOCC001255 [Frankliniella occidentalis]|nr:hypothetical protein FOCC_FOCC001255 [Frankliniella occidentalis]
MRLRKFRGGVWSRDCIRTNSSNTCIEYSVITATNNYKEVLASVTQVFRTCSKEKKNVSAPRLAEVSLDRQRRSAPNRPFQSEAAPG